jgi:hypothetical protein
MQSQLLLLDPALLVWDRADYLSRERDYWQLADDFMSLLDVIDESPFKVVLSSELSESMISAFPADQFGASSGLHDFTRAVYAFLARMLATEEAYPGVTLAGITPDVCARAHFAADVASQLSKCIAFAFAAPEPATFASHTLTWGYPQRIVTHPGQVGRTLGVCLTRAEYEGLRLALRREYEPNDKHHPVAGYGSRLPPELSAAEVQRALDVAIELKSADCLCAKAQAVNVVLLFRRHHQNKYHAYPVDSSEYSKYGIKIDLVPAAN